MSKKRQANPSEAFPTRRDGDGKLLCAVCGKPLKKGLRRYCSKTCTDICYVATMPSYAREMVRRRDLGVCAICGHDTEMLKRILRKASGSRWGARQKHELDRMDINSLKTKLGYTTDHFWEMDHTLPVVEGGGLCGMDNLRTLCIPCHREETKELATRRAFAKRGAPLFAGVGKE